MSWSLVSTMLGDPETLLPCIAHYLNSDAARLHIYLDAPSPAIEAALADHPRCVVTVCDEAYWTGRHGRRPKGVVRRQRANVEDARLRSDSDWLVHVDSDEFVVQGDGGAGLRLSAALDTVPDEIDWVRIPPLERLQVAGREVRTIFDGLFRRQTSDEALLAEAYGAGAEYLDKGLSAHSRGKIAFRRTTDFTVRLHDLRDEEAEHAGKGRKRRPGRRGALVPFVEFPSLSLLHFDGWSPLHWTRKIRRFADEELFQGHHAGRSASIRYMAAHPQPADQQALFPLVQQVSPEGLALLDAAGLIHHTPFDPTPLTRATFPGVTFDFSVTGFDQRLQARQATPLPGQGG